MNTRPSNPAEDCPYGHQKALVSVELVSEIDAVTTSPKPRMATFGITSMFVCTAVLSIQFALTSYFGAVAAVFSPFLILLVMVMLSFVDEFVWRDERYRRWHEQFSAFVTYRGFFYLVLLTISGYSLGGAHFSFQALSDHFLEHRIKKNLGFDFDIQSIWHDNEYYELIEMDSIVTGGRMHQAGIAKGDVIVSK